MADENAPRNQYSKDKANVDQLKAMQAMGIGVVKPLIKTFVSLYSWLVDPSYTSLNLGYLGALGV